MKKKISRLKQKNFKGGPRNMLLMLLFFVGTVYILTRLTDHVLNTQSIPYSDFITAVGQDKVKEVMVTGDNVRGKFKQNAQAFETTMPHNSDKAYDVLQDHGVSVRVVEPSGFQTWHMLLFGAFLALLLMGWYLLRQIKGGSGGGGGNPLFGMGKSRARMFMPSTIKTTFGDVAGAHEAKEDLKDVIDFLKDPEKFRRLGAKQNRGILLVGEPGNGKTLLAKAVAGEANCPFFSISGSDFIEVFVGVGAARVRDLFAQARKNAPCIIFIDEIDTIGRKRSSGGSGGSEERDQTLNQLLTEMDGFTTKGGDVIVMAATNRPDILDKALLRPGRLGRRIHVPFPDITSREKILAIHGKKVTLDPAVDLHEVARGTGGFSGADLAGLINEAAMIATKEAKDSVTMADIDEARDKIILGRPSQSVIMNDYERELTAYHEAGHALVGLMMPHDHIDPLYKVTIVPRGGALGVTHSLPERDKYVQTKEHCLAYIAMCMGGRAGEFIRFGVEGSGARSDFNSATQLARDMVCNFGMSEKLGPVIYQKNYSTSFYSERTLALIDSEIQNILEKCMATAKEILSTHRDKLDALAKALLERETLHAQEIYELLSLEPRTDFRLGVTA